MLAFRQITDKAEFEKYLELLLIYLGTNVDVEPEELRDQVNKILEEGGAVMNSVFQRLKKEGKEEGKKEGEDLIAIRIAENCIMKGLDIQTISELTELPVYRIEALRANHQPQNVAHP